MMSFSAEQTPSQKHLCCLLNRLPLQQWVCLQKNKLPSQNYRYYKCRHYKLVVWRRNFLCNNDVSICRKMLSKDKIPDKNVGVCRTNCSHKNVVVCQMNCRQKSVIVACRVNAVVNGRCFQQNAYRHQNECWLQNKRHHIRWAL